jgi:carboxypeptidase D
MQDETELAAQFVGFMQQFLKVFAELKGKNFYLAGESVCILCLDFDRYSCLL